MTTNGIGPNKIGASKSSATSPAKQKLDKTRSVKQIQKQYPGAEPKKDKPGEYTYKGVTLIPGKYKGDDISDKEKIIKAIKGKKNGF